MNVDRKTDAKNTHFRDKATIRRLQMYKTRKPASEKERYKQSQKPATIDPNRKWFGNTRLMNQDEMDKYKNILSEMKDDPQKVRIKSKLLPHELLTVDLHKSKNMDLLSVQPFQDTFGKKSKRKKPKLVEYDFNKILNNIEIQNKEYNKVEDKMSLEFIPKEKEATDEKFITAGQSRRIWDELYKVLDSSDVIMQVLDARDPNGTRSYNVEN